MSSSSVLNPALRAPARQRPSEARPAKPHICFVAPHAWPVFSRNPDIQLVGGAEVQQSTLARALVRRDYRVSMICLDFGQPQRTTLDGVTVHKTYRPGAGLPVLRYLHPRITGMWRAMRQVDADVYYQRSSAMLTAVVAEFCRQHRRRSIYAAASDVDLVPGRQLIRFRRDRWLFERGLARVDALIVQNEMQKRDCRANYGRESTLIQSCYELPASARPGNGDCVLWVASMHDRKRPELFLDLARRIPHRRFVMIGGPGHSDSHGEAHFEKLRTAAAALPNLEFTGFLPLARVEQYFDQARVFVNTSQYQSEGMPNTFLQAWARGVPIAALFDVGARLGSEPLYPAAHTLEELASQVEHLCADTAYWKRASTRSLAYFAGSHSVAAAVAQYEQLFAGLALEQRPAR